jgi:hypothetical protein
VLRGGALREARAAVGRRGERRDRALCQTRLLVEVARRVAEPTEGLPRGSRPTVRLGLYRQAAYWALIAGRPDGGAPGGGDAPPDLAAAWAGADQERLRQAAGGDAALDGLEQMLIHRSRPDALDITDEDAARARAFVDGLVADLDAPRRRVDRIRIGRWLRVGLCVLVIALFAWGVHRLSLGRNVLAGKPFRTSSTWDGCSGDPGCQALLFHTNPEFNPWVEYDLGPHPATFHRIEVTNRGDCCAERAIPLVVEVSNDRTSWTEIARRDDDFSTWTVKVAPTTARYFRLRVPRSSTFHLKDVVLR